MTRRTLISLAGLALLIGAASMYAWKVWPPRVAERDSVERSLRAYEASIGNQESQASITGPRTRAWHADMIRLSQTATRQELLQRDLLDIVTVLDLRRKHTIEQLQELTVDQVLRAKEPGTPGPFRPFEIHDLVIQGDQAEARLTKQMVDRNGATHLLEFGTEAFFTKENGRWFFESWVLQSKIMNRTKPFLDDNSKVQLIEQTFDDLDPALWDGPRR